MINVVVSFLSSYTSHGSVTLNPVPTYWNDLNSQGIPKTS